MRHRLLAVPASLVLVLHAADVSAAWSITATGASSAAAAALAAPSGLTVTGQSCTPTTTSTTAWRTSSTATGTTQVTVARPADVVTGDLMIVTYAQRNENAVITAPAGWTQVGLRREAGYLTGIWTRGATAAEPTSFSWDSSAADNAVAVLLAYDGVDASAPVDVSASDSEVKTTDITAPSVMTTRENVRLVGAFVVLNASGIAPPADMTERAEVAVSGGIAAQLTVEMADTPVGPAGATGTRTAVAGSSGDNTGWVVALKPESFPQAHLSWTATTSAFADGYAVRRLTGGSEVGARTVSGSGTTSATETPLAAGTGYTLELRSTASGWRSAAATTSFTSITTC